MAVLGGGGRSSPAARRPSISALMRFNTCREGKQGLTLAVIQSRHETSVHHEHMLPKQTFIINDYSTIGITIKNGHQHICSVPHTVE